jgi:hypothetical protein
LLDGKWRAAGRFSAASECRRKWVAEGRPVPGHLAVSQFLAFG